MIGEIVTHFKISAKLGQGGMGVVYKAKDIRLERVVALKMLRSEAIGDPDAKKRFLREARSASILSHTNITTIYEIDEWKGQDFIVMEYVEGKTIREMIKNEKLKIKNVVEYAIQICKALADAHDFQIIHRDIKSGNIMVTPKGQIKVMDFGLAKIAGSVTKTKIHPTVGTIAYMSPEQTKGKGVDFRTDIWSFGVVLYELLTGELPFNGDYEQAIIYSILNEEPEKMNVVRPDIPQQLENIVNKALSKKKEERYGSTQELLEKLTLVLKELNSHDPHQRNSKKMSALFLKSLIAKNRFRIGLFISLVMILLYFAVIINIKNSSLLPMESKPLTTFDGAELYPAISPDGHRFLFTWNGENRDNWDIYLKLIGIDEYKRFTDNPAIEYSATWSDDQNRFAFIRLGEEAGIYCKSIFGGQEKKLQRLCHTTNSSDITPRVDWSPDGLWLAFNDYDSAATNHAIYKLNLTTMEKKRLTLAEPQLIGDMNPKISPDGKWLAFRRVITNRVSDLYLLNLENKKLKPLTSDRRNVSGLAWTADGEKIVFVSNRDGISRLWTIGMNGRKLKALEIGGRNAIHLSLCWENSMLAYDVENRAANILQADIDNIETGVIKPYRLVISSKSEKFPVYSPDNNKIAFSSDRTGQSEIYICSQDGSDVVQMTDLKSGSGVPKWSPCGSFIAFDSRPHGNSDILIIDVNGGEPMRYLTTHAADDRIPSWSQDGEYIYFGSNRKGAYQIYQMPMDGGEAEQITQNGGLYGYESFDGAFLFFQKYLETEGVIYQINLTTRQESVAIAENINQLVWVTRPEGIYYIVTNEENKPILKLYRYPERTTEQIGRFENWHRFSDVSNDAKHILLWTYEDYAADIFLVENFR